jgi:integrase
MGDGIRLPPKRRTYTIQVTVPRDLRGRVIGARGQPVNIIERSLDTTDRRDAETKGAIERGRILAMFADIRKGLPVPDSELERIAATTGHEAYDQLAAKYFQPAEIETASIDVQWEIVFGEPRGPNKLLNGATTTAYAERKLISLGVKPAPATIERLAEMILQAQQRAIDALKNGMHLPALPVAAQPATGKGPRLAEVQELYTADRRKELSARSLKKIPRAFNSLIKFAGNVPIDSLTRATASNWVREMAEHSKPSSVNRALVVVTNAWTWCIDHGRIPAEVPSPFTRLSRKINRQKDKYLPFDVAELNRLLLPSPLRHHILIGLYSGMRAAEITTAKLVTVHGIQCFEIAAGKTDAAARRVPVHPALAEAGVARWHKELAKFTSGTLSNKFLEWRREQGITDPRKVLHSLRANFTTALEEAGVPQSTAKLIVGHKRGDITYGHYSSGVGLKTLAAAVGRVAYQGLKL